MATVAVWVRPHGEGGRIGDTVPVQDRYAGDVGDFSKYGLLRWLTASVGEHPPLSLGVVWYLTPDESHNADGKHVSYLQPGNRAGEQLRRLDPDSHRDLLDRSPTPVLAAHELVDWRADFGATGCSAPSSR